MNKVRIGITDCSKWENYAKWFREKKEVEVIKLSYNEWNLNDISGCKGIVLSGGEDVHPRFYNKPEYLNLLKPEEIKVKRDEFELEVIGKSLQKKKTHTGNLPWPANSQCVLWRNANSRYTV